MEIFDISLSPVNSIPPPFIKLNRYFFLFEISFLTFFNFIVLTVLIEHTSSIIFHLELNASSNWI